MQQRIQWFFTMGIRSITKVLWDCTLLTFKRFQVLLTQRIGIPTNQLSAVFVCRRTLKDIDKRRKLPINENTNFNIILNQHNPNKEKDCHFLVSIKKSKKERKGTRKRNAEAENPDDEESNSSRGDLSPSDERPNPGRGTDEHFSPYSTSPPAYLERSSTPPTSPSPNASGHRKRHSSPNGKTTTPTSEGKVERTLLRREGMGQSGFASPCAGRQKEGMLSQSVEGFSLPSAEKGGSPQSPHGQNVEEPPKMENKAWGLQEAAADPGLQSERMDGHGAAQQPQHLLQGPLVDSFHQERFYDSMPQSPRVSPGSSGMRSNGIIQANTTLTSRSSMFSSNPMLSGSPFPIRGAIGNFVARMVTGQSYQLMLQHAQQALMSQMQQHQHEQSITMSPLEVSKLSNVFRDLVEPENRAETRKICELCCFWQDQNITEPPFHWCVNDTIFMGFRGASPAGPIGRPSGRPVEAAT